ncbi:uncharacterized protein LOC108599219 [Drosophila busckii]|uniref:uncharacterized protein LOC108599219 n=1 Tax=Drosophila busckii TaxID=30019 RepID=UPI00083F2FFD|nr:uncharacterized protein LOC108599219 [Drosophila busckii]
MISALNGFGLVIGWMDIMGALLFELMIVYTLRRRCKNNSNAAGELHATELQQQQQEQQNDIINVRPWMLWAYLLLLNVWILVSLLMIAGILLHQPNLLLFWLVWCMCGLLFDVLFVLWWCWELIVGDAFEALTNILISLLTMVIEFGFIYVIYHIYMNLLDVPHMPAFKLRFLKPLF